MAGPIPNRYIHRKVADSTGKSCDVCFKITTSVLVTEGKEDFFYVCPIHLKDANFCHADPDALKEMRDRESQAIIDEWKAKQKLKEERERERVAKEEADKKKEEDKKEGKEGKEGKEEETKKSDDKDKGKEKEDEKNKDDEKKDEDEMAVESEPRVFNLKPPFFKRRTAKKRQAEEARRARSIMQQPNLFPSVPKDPPR